MSKTDNLTHFGPLEAVLEVENGRFEAKTDDFDHLRLYLATFDSLEVVFEAKTDDSRSFLRPNTRKKKSLSRKKNHFISFQSPSSGSS